jgi:hypothetical protein
MVKIQFKTIDIRRSENTTIRKDVPAWEVPVLEAVHGDVTVIDDLSVSSPIGPNANDEYMRLSNLYKNTKNEDGSQGVPFVAAVYGQFQQGIEALGEAIAKSVSAEENADLA